MSDVQTLVDMGFTKEKVEYALKITNGGVEPAMEWLLVHADEDVPAAATDGGKEVGTDTASSSTPTTAAESEAPGVAKSLKCDDCGKLCLAGEVQYHATKTGHTSFSESADEKPPLTEDERKVQIKLIEEKLKLKRVEREERERADALEREKNRIKSGKDMTEARKRMEELEMKKLVDQRKREKDEEKAARDRVRGQIEADKAARKAKEQATTPKQAAPVAEPSPVTSTTVASPTGAKSSPKEYTETRIQIRLQDGSTLQETFSVKEQLSAVRVFIQMKVGNDIEQFGLMTTFPRKVFVEDDFEKPLDVLGLVPSAVLTMTKSLA